jgi:hypothetical protein
MTRLRLCPTVEGTQSPLITHLIGVETCLSRQRACYHKCHRCQYRGQPASFELPLPAELSAGAEMNGAQSVNGTNGIIPAQGKSKAKAKPAKKAASRS